MTQPTPRRRFPLVYWLVVLGIAVVVAAWCTRPVPVVVTDQEVTSSPTGESILVVVTMDTPTTTPSQTPTPTAQVATLSRTAGPTPTFTPLPTYTPTYTPATTPTSQPTPEPTPEPTATTVWPPGILLPSPIFLPPPPIDTPRAAPAQAPRS